MANQITLSNKEIQSIRQIIEREQDRILLKLRTANDEMRVHLTRMLNETKVALLPFTEPEGI